MTDQAWTYRVERIEVPEHVAHRMTVPQPDSDWVFTTVRTGCIRVQRGDFTAYIPPEALEGLVYFINDHLNRIEGAQSACDLLPVG